MHYGGPDYIAKANEEILVFGMIETKEGLENLEAICATPAPGRHLHWPGRPVVCPRPGAPAGQPAPAARVDLRQDSRKPPTAMAKRVCMHCQAAPFAIGAIKRGFDMVMLTTDLYCLGSMARKQLEDLKAGIAA